MDKFKAASIALLVVSVICIALAANAAVIANQLGSERQKSDQLKSQVSKLEAAFKAKEDAAVNAQREIESLRTRLDEETRGSQDLRLALESEKAINQGLRQEIDSFKNVSSAEVKTEGVVTTSAPATK